MRREEAAKSGTHSTIRWAHNDSEHMWHNTTVWRRYTTTTDGLKTAQTQLSGGHTTTHWREGTQQHTGRSTQRQCPHNYYVGTTTHRTIRWAHNDSEHMWHNTTVWRGHTTTHWREAHNDTLNLQVGTKKWAHNNTLNY